MLGPREGTKEHQQLKDEIFFSYWQVLGELMYAYTLIRCNIGYAVTFLAHFASRPSKEYYHALKYIAQYLCATTKDWGIVYHKGKPLS